MTHVALAVAMQGVLLAAILMAMESQRPLANRLLAALLLVLSLRIVAPLLFYFGAAGDHGVLGIVFHNSSFLLGPLLYAYARALIDDDFRLRAEHAVHLLPAVLGVYWSFSDWANYRQLPDQPGLIRLSAVHGLCASLALAVYCRAVFLQLRRYRSRLMDTYSAIERISLNWLRVLVGLVLLMGAASAAVNGFIFFTAQLLNPIFLVVVPLCVVVFYVVAIFGFRQSSVLLIRARPTAASEAAAAAHSETSSDEGDAAAENTAKYKRSALDAEQLQRLWQRVEALMVEQALYQDPELQLPTLAARLGISTHALSQVFGSHAGVKFYDYINGLRVVRARELLRDPRHRQATILEISLAAGFNAKSTFNKCFKQVVGQAPSAYRRAAGSDAAPADCPGGAPALQRLSAPAAE